MDSDFKEDLEKILSVGNRKWKLVDRQHIARNFARIDSDPRLKRMGKVDLQFSDYYGSRYGGASSEIISHDKEAGLAYGVFPRCICTRSNFFLAFFASRDEIFAICHHCRPKIPMSLDFYG